jgi:hypothetical protein
LELASRLSFFLWSSIPDEELLRLAEQGRLDEPAMLQAQVERMLKDPKSRALVDSFATQWLRLRNLRSHSPIAHDFPNFDNELREAFRIETELFFGSIIREDRSVLDLLNADYTYVNERLARHYGIPNVYGSHFRRVTLDPNSPRRGILGQGSMQTVTSVATRTSPVMRGKWVLENLLGAPPPEPPPGVEVNLDPAPGAAPTTLRPGVRVVPQGDGPDRLRARELRPGGHLARNGRPGADRRLGPAGRRHAAQGPGRPAEGPFGPQRRVSHVGHGKAADLRNGAADCGY